MRSCRFPRRPVAPALITLFLLAMAPRATAGPRNFTSPEGPLYQGCDSSQVAPDAEPDLRVVTFNIKYSIEVDKAIELLIDESQLRTADIVLLQEMDEAGVEKIGRALDMCWVYYPAVVHPRQGRDFGNAILSRLPLTDPRKIILPHLGGFGRTQRIATAASVEYEGELIRVYSVHVATQVELGPPFRRDQVMRVIEDAAASKAARVIIGARSTRTGAPAITARSGP
ncbi:MAG: endonuclease/exonuclease/phosphatase [bacterium]|nr:MAG: endonuclease/exonuclease/phosphatase [bacterium]